MTDFGGPTDCVDCNALTGVAFTQHYFEAHEGGRKMTDAEVLSKIDAIRPYTPKAGDIVFIEVPIDTPPENVGEIKYYVERLFKTGLGVEVVVATGAHISVISTGENK